MTTRTLLLVLALLAAGCDHCGAWLDGFATGLDCETRGPNDPPCPPPEAP